MNQEILSVRAGRAYMCTIKERTGYYPDILRTGKIQYMYAASNGADFPADHPNYMYMHLDGGSSKDELHSNL